MMDFKGFIIELYQLTVVEKEPVYLPFWEKGIKYFNALGPDGERVEFSERLR